VASTFLGADGDEGPYNQPGIVINNENEIFVAGVTYSTNFPTSPTANKDYLSGTNDYCITKFSNDLSTILASTYLGGGSGEAFPAIALDNNGSLVLGGSTQSSDYPTTPGVYNRNHSAGHYYNNALTKFDNNLSIMEASTYIGGGSAFTISLDNSGNIYSTGHVNYAEYPTSLTAYDRTYNGYNEGFVTKMDNTLQDLLASTFLSGNTTSFGMGNIACDDNGNIFIGGSTGHAHFPVTSDGFDQSYGGGVNDWFLMELDDQLSTLKYSSFHGGSGEDATSSIVCDNMGNPIYAGMTSSTDFWTSDDAAYQDYKGGSMDWFIIKSKFLDYICGDVDENGIVDILDIIFMIDWKFKNGPVPDRLEAANVNGDDIVDILDIIYLIDNKFKGGPAPCSDISKRLEIAQIFYEGCKESSNSNKTDFRAYSPKNDCIYFNYNGTDILEITHINAGFNCCPGIIVVNACLINNVITVAENETSQDCFCQCLYDIGYEISGLPPAIYTIRFIEPYVTGGDETLEFTLDLTKNTSGSYCVTRDHYPW
jgi:hypothetical protein